MAFFLLESWIFESAVIRFGVGLDSVLYLLAECHIIFKHILLVRWASL